MNTQHGTFFKPWCSFLVYGAWLLYLCSLAGWAASSYDTELLDLTNAERAKHDLAPLQYAADLGEAAQQHAIDMAQNSYIGHVGSDGSTLDVRLGKARYAYTLLGENVAAGSANPERTLQQWMNSGGHRANILNPDFDTIGFGFSHNVDSRYGYYWVQVFGTQDRSSAEQTRQDPRLVTALLAEIGYFSHPLAAYRDTKLRQQALNQLQKDLDLPQTGMLDNLTWQHLQSIKLSQHSKNWLAEQGLLIK